MRAGSPRRYPVEVQRPDGVNRGRVYPAVPGSGPENSRRTPPRVAAARPGSPSKNVRWDLEEMSSSAVASRPVSQPWFNTMRAAPEEIQYVVVRELRERLACFYRLYDSRNLRLVDTLVQSFIERGSTQEALEELNEELWRIYGRDLNCKMSSLPNSTHSGHARRTRYSSGQDTRHDSVGSRTAESSNAHFHPMFDMVVPPRATRSPTQFNFQNSSVWNSTPMTDFSYPPHSPPAVNYGEFHSPVQPRSPRAVGALVSQQHSSPHLNGNARGSTWDSVDHGDTSAFSHMNSQYSASPQTTLPTSPRQMPSTLPICPSKSRFQPFRMDVLAYTVVALVGFVPRHADEMAFSTNDVMVVTGECIDGWLLASKRGSEGLIPAAYLRFIGSDGQQVERGR